MIESNRPQRIPWPQYHRRHTPQAKKPAIQNQQHSSWTRERAPRLSQEGSCIKFEAIQIVIPAASEWVRVSLDLIDARVLRTMTASDARDLLCNRIGRVDDLHLQVGAPAGRTKWERLLKPEPFQFGKHLIH